MKTILYIATLFGTLAAADLPLKVRADQALSQFQTNIQAKNYSGALPWLEKSLALESEGFKLPASMNFFAGQVYVKNGMNDKAVPLLEAYMNQASTGKYFWEAVELLAEVSPSKGKQFLESYLAKDDPPYFQQALALYADICPIAKGIEDSLAKEAAIRDFPPLLTDSRNGKSYKTKRIGNQGWMVQNLNYEVGTSWCYDSDTSNCTKWGRLYDKITAQIACPDGWHLPSDSEWVRLNKNVREGPPPYTRAHGLQVLKSLMSVSMSGTNTSGFDALPSGQRDMDGNFKNAGISACYWASDEDTTSYRQFSSEDKSVLRVVFASEKIGCSVRCLRNRPFNR